MTVTLKPDVVERLNRVAEQTRTSLDELVDEALRDYLAKYHQEKIHVEVQAFERQHDQLLADYPGEYVAMHGGQVIDHDLDLETLHLRVYTRLGDMPVLLRKVTAGPQRDLIFRK